MERRIGGTVAGVPTGQTVALSLNGGAPEAFADGAFAFSSQLKEEAAYGVRVTTQPAGVYCVVARGFGAVRAGGDVTDVTVRCDSDPSTPLFDTSRVQRLRLTITADDWDAFVLNSDRSRYVHDAFGWESWFLPNGVSEIYRKGKLEWLDDAGGVRAAVADVGFRMRGTTSRLWPEYWEEVAKDDWQGRPRRFHFNFKFDEDFSRDESVYACIDAAGQPAQVWQARCNGRIADDIPTIAANKDRTFLGLESLAAKYNKDDPTYVREPLAYAVLNERGVPAGRAASASLELVILADEAQPDRLVMNKPLPQTYDMGVFTIIEPIDKPYLTRASGPFGKNGYLFKVSGGDLTDDDAEGCIPWESHGSTYLSASFCVIGIEQPDPVSRAEWLGAAASDPQSVNALINVPITIDGNLINPSVLSQFSPYRALYDLKTKKKEIATARAALRALIDLVKAPGTTPEQIAEVFDVDGFIRTQAAEIAVGAVDHYARVANNYYLYLNPDTGKWSYIPYDLDFTFRDTHISSWPDNPPFSNVATSTVFSGPNAWTAIRIDGVTPRLWDIVFSSEANRARLLTELTELRHEWLDWDHRVGPLVRSWVDQLEPYIASTTAGSPESGDTDYSRAAALGDSYTYASWVGAGNSHATTMGGAFPPDAWATGIPSTDTLKSFVQRRSVALAPEAP